MVEKNHYYFLVTNTALFNICHVKSLSVVESAIHYKINIIMKARNNQVTPVPKFSDFEWPHHCRNEYYNLNIIIVAILVTMILGHHYRTNFKDQIRSRWMSFKVTFLILHPSKEHFITLPNPKWVLTLMYRAVPVKLLWSLNGMWRFVSGSKYLFARPKSIR